MQTRSVKQSIDRALQVAAQVGATDACIRHVLIGAAATGMYDMTIITTERQPINEALLRFEVTGKWPNPDIQPAIDRTSITESGLLRTARWKAGEKAQQKGFQQCSEEHLLLEILRCNNPELRAIGQKIGLDFKTSAALLLDRIKKMPEENVTGATAVQRGVGQASGGRTSKKSSYSRA